MYEELLRVCDLTQNESLVYLALLKLSKAKSGEIVKEAKISGGKIYETLYKLIDKGLIKYVEENGVKNFIANEPETLLDYLKEKEKTLHEKEKQLEEILPQLKSIKTNDLSFDAVSLTKGTRGIKTLVYKSLEKGKEISIMGVSSSKNARFNDFWMAWHDYRVKLKKKARIIFSDKNTDYWKFFKKLKHTEVREILHFTPSAILIIDNESFIFSYDNDLICVHIIMQSITQSFLQFFNDLWNIDSK